MGQSGPTNGQIIKP